MIVRLEDSQRQLLYQVIENTKHWSNIDMKNSHTWFDIHIKKNSKLKPRIIFSNIRVVSIAYFIMHHILFLLKSITKPRSRLVLIPTTIVLWSKLEKLVINLLFPDNVPQANGKRLVHAFITQLNYLPGVNQCILVIE